MRIAVIGLGKLGICTAACFAASGHQVTGFDLNLCTLDAIRARRAPLKETGLDELLEAAWPNLSVAATLAEAVRCSEATVIIVPTPSLADGRFDNRFVSQVLTGIAPVLREKEEFHVVDLVSTVMPGSCRRDFIPLLERLSGKRCGHDFGLAYNPEFIALGSVIRDFLNPDLVLIGASDPRSGALVAELYRSTCVSDPRIAVMSLVNAEITKISLNCFVTMKISYANALAALCEGIPGADIDVVSGAIGADSRVGRKYLTGGIGFGGPCFPRDNLAFQRCAEEFGAEALLGKAVVAVNRAIPARLFGLIRDKVAPGGTVALLGLSYKPETHVVEESQSIMLAKRLQEAGYRLKLHDPQALDAASLELGGSADCQSDPYDCAAGADAIVLLTDWPLYRGLDWDRIAAGSAPGTLVLDSWRAAQKAGNGHFDYRPLGRGTGVKP